MEQKTALVLEDDGVFRYILRQTFTSLGLRVLEAKTGKEATALAAANKLDIVFVDGLLPDTTGEVWIREFRKHDNQTLIAFASAFWRDAASTNRLRRELFVSWVVPKPVAIRSLIERTCAMLKIQLDPEMLTDLVQTLEPSPPKRMSAATSAPSAV